MTGRTSQNTSTRHPHLARGRRLRALLHLAAVLACLAASLATAAWLPELELGRAIGAHLDQLADPESWIP